MIHMVVVAQVHEMCHVAAWLIDHTAKPPHGPAFKAWAARAMKVQVFYLTSHTDSH